MKNEQLQKALDFEYHSGRGFRLREEDFTNVKVLLAANYSYIDVINKTGLSYESINRIKKQETWKDYLHLMKNRNNKKKEWMAKVLASSAIPYTTISSPTPEEYAAAKEMLFQGESVPEIAREIHRNFFAVKLIADSKTFEEFTQNFEAKRQEMGRKISAGRKIANEKRKERKDEIQAQLEEEEQQAKVQLPEPMPLPPIPQDPEEKNYAEELNDARKALDVAIARFIAEEVRVRLKALREPSLSEQVGEMLDDE